MGARPLVLGLAAFLLTGCSGPPAPPVAGVDHVEIAGYPDDVDCDGVVDMFVVFRALGPGSRAPVTFTGALDALLERQVVAGAYQPVDNWSAQLAPDKFGPDGSIQWFEQGQKLVSGTYRLTASARVEGQGNFTGSSEVRFRTAGLAEPRSC